MHSGQNCALGVKYELRNIKTFGPLHIFYTEEIPVLVVLLHARDKFPRIPLHFMEPKVSLPQAQMPATCPYPEPARSSQHPHTPLSEDPS